MVGVAGFEPVDYKYYDFGAHTILDGLYDPAWNNLGGPGLDVFRVHPTENSVTARISYKFDLFAPPAPVVAKY